MNAQNRTVILELWPSEGGEPQRHYYSIHQRDELIVWAKRAASMDAAFYTAIAVKVVTDGTQRDRAIEAHHFIPVLASPAAEIAGEVLDAPIMEPPLHYSPAAVALENYHIGLITNAELIAELERLDRDGEL